MINVRALSCSLCDLPPCMTCHRRAPRHREVPCFTRLPEIVLNPPEDLRFTVGSNAHTFTPYPLLQQIHSHVQQHLRHEFATWLFTVPRFVRLPEDLLHTIAAFLFQEPDESVPRLYERQSPWPDPVAQLPPGTTWNHGRFRLSDDRRAVTNNGQPWLLTSSLEFLAALPTLIRDRRRAT
jgi:hypothetical protein